MKGYQRFVAYVYEYRRGRKEENCGYVRVEARDDRCSMEVHLKCVGLPEQAHGEIYGFVRRQGQIQGYLLAECRTVQDGLECSFETETDRLGEGPVTLAELGGMVIMTEGGAFFGTEWDDIPIRPDMFVVYKGIENNAEENVEQKESAEPVNAAEQSEFTEAPNAVEHMESAEALNETVQEESAELTETVEQSETGDDLEAAEIANQAECISENTDNAHAFSENQSNRSPILNREQLLRVQQNQEDFQPFSDGEIADCRKLSAEDFRFLHPRDRGLRGNRFVAYSYRQFGYVLVGRMNNGQYILGLPGGYDQQERVMANMFGFPYFKESPEIELPRGRGGYWYRLINTPNFH